ncbi:MAG: right-handed parallel beta-helix repeat-containing protein, partial [Bacteroidota bacterium]
NVNDFRMENCQLERAFDAAGTFNGNDHQIRHNVFRKIGLTRGLGFYYGGISVDVNNLVLERNIVQEIGYVGITFSGNNLLIQENEVSDVCKILDDGGGIYSYNGEETRNADQNRILRKNFIQKVNQAAEGVPYLDPLSAGIYMDSGVQNVDISENTIRDCIGPGIYLHNARHNRVRANNLYFNSTGISLVDDQTSHIRSQDNLITQNKVLMIDKDRQSIEVLNLKDDLPLKNLGTLDSNYYVDPFYNSRVRYMQSLENIGVLTLEKWKTLFGQDLNTQGTPFVYPTFSIEKYLDTNLIQNGSFQNEMDEWYCQKDCNLAIENNQVSFGHNQSAQAIWEYVELVQDISVNEVGYYEFKFKARAAKSGSNIYFYLRQNKSPYKKISDLIFAPLTQEEAEYSFFIETYQLEAGASLVIRASDIDGQVWMDDISLRPVLIKERNIADLIQIVENPSDQPLALDLSQSSYLSLDQVFYSQGSQASLAPYQSVALLKVEEEDRGTNSDPTPTPLNPTTLNSIQIIEPVQAIEIQWEDNNQAELGYLIERRGANGPYERLDSLPVNAGSYTDKSPLPNQVNYYRVKAYDALQEAIFIDSIGVDLGLLVEEVNLVEGFESIPVYPLGNDIQVDQKFLAAFNSTLEPLLSKAADSVYFALSDRLVFGKMDRTIPFRFMSDAENMALGTYTLKVTPYKDGLEGVSKTVDFELVKRKIITELNLMEINTRNNLGNLMDQQKRPIQNQMAYGMFATVTDPLITGVTFQMGGKEKYYRNEKFRPYSLFGDENNKINGQVWTPGWYSLMTLVYTQVGPRKVYWDTLTVNFSVREGEWVVHKVIPEEDILQSQSKSVETPKNSLVSADLNVYPVPAHDFLNLVIPGEFRMEKTSIQIFNTGGEMVLQEDLEVDAQKNQARLSLQSLKRGLYHFQLRLGKEQYSGKFTVQK